MKFHEKGFTLIELMIVIAIIGILAAIAIPNFLNARGKAHDASAKATLEAMKTALEMYSASVGSYPDAINPGTLFTAMAGTNDWPSNITWNNGGGAGLNPGTLTDYTVDNSFSTFLITTIGQDTSHYFHLTNSGILSGPDSVATN